MKIIKFKKSIVFIVSVVMILILVGCASDEEKKVSNQAFENAESLFKSENYSEAIEEYEKVIEEDDDFEQAQKRIEEAKDTIYQRKLEQIKSLASNKNYGEAISMLTDMINDYDKDEIENLLEEYRQSYTDDLLSTAKAYADEKDYYNAITFLSEHSYDKDNYDYEAVETQLNEYKQTYADYALTEADSLVSEKQYDNAISLLENAVSAMPDNEKINAKLNEINETKPITLSDIKVTNSDKFEQITDNAVEDTIGNTYAPGNLYEVYEYYGNGFGEFYLGKEYKKLTGVVAPSDKCGNCTGRLEIYSNDKMIHSVKFNRKTTPVTIDLDISNSEWLKIQVAYVETDNSDGSPYILLSDFQLDK